MKNSIIIVVLLFAFTLTANAQEPKPKAKKEACCSADKKAGCTTDHSKCCIVAVADKKNCCAKDKAKADSSVTENHSCTTAGACCSNCKEAKAKS